MIVIYIFKSISTMIIYNLNLLYNFKNIIYINIGRVRIIYIGIIGIYTVNRFGRVGRAGMEGRLKIYFYNF